MQPFRTFQPLILVVTPEFHDLENTEIRYKTVIIGPDGAPATTSPLKSFAEVVTHLENQVKIHAKNWDF